MGISRSSLVYTSKKADNDRQLAESIKALGEKYPRFGYRRIGVMLGWQRNEKVNAKRVYRIWKMLNLQLPKKRPRGKRSEAEYPGHCG